MRLAMYMAAAKQIVFYGILHQAIKSNQQCHFVQMGLEQASYRQFISTAIDTTINRKSTMSLCSSPIYPLYDTQNSMIATSCKDISAGYKNRFDHRKSNSGKE